MRPLRHDIITRFGIGVLNDAWFERRLKHLSATVIPSLEKQTCQNFTWFVLIGMDMPLAARRQLEALLEPNANFQILKVDHLRDGFFPNEFFRNRMLESGEIVTSRIDDDDLLHVQAIDEIQAAAAAVLANNDMGIIYHPKGIELNLSDRKIYDLELHAASIGLSVAARRGSFKHAYGLYHTRVREVAKSHNCPAVPLQPERVSWLYVRHSLGDNTSGGARVTSKSPSVGSVSLQWLIEMSQMGFAFDAGRLNEIMESEHWQRPRVLSGKRTLLQERQEVIRNLQKLNALLDEEHDEARQAAFRKEFDEQYQRYQELGVSVFDD